MDNSLDIVKVRFTKSTTDDVARFKQEIGAFKERFMTEGPGVIGTPGVHAELLAAGAEDGAEERNELDVGLDLMELYKVELAAVQGKREKLVRAEKLFDLPITSYPDLVFIEDEIAGLDTIYGLYARFKADREEWSKRRWSELDVDVLVAGIARYQKELKHMTAALHLIPYGIVKGHIQGFKETIPLFSDLKNEALRDRHWKQLMEVTGKHFDLTSKDFTLKVYIPFF